MDDLQEFDPVCPTCHAPWAGIERVVAERAALREENVRLKAGLADATALAQHREPILAEVTHLRAHVAALVKQLQAMLESYDILMHALPETAMAFGVVRGAFLRTPSETRLVLDSPDLADLADREQRRDAVIEAAQRFLRVADDVLDVDDPTSPFVDVVPALEDALRALDAAPENP